jgi:hypothetical protein
MRKTVTFFLFMAFWASLASANETATLVPGSNVCTPTTTPVYAFMTAHWTSTAHCPAISYTYYAIVDGPPYGTCGSPTELQDRFECRNTKACIVCWHYNVTANPTVTETYPGCARSELFHSTYHPDN